MFIQFFYFLVQSYEFVSEDGGNTDYKEKECVTHSPRKNKQVPIGHRIQNRRQDYDKNSEQDE
ncbi:hypothetical protein LPTSP1_17200 [Leptospira johnsonii]|uniref:Uncharacterized protein n=1 Tax=Leptospira johnsonii TaxID=1917820 RepID=A0A2P2D230_9LEPT|nr:hypothetical protein LPTSP1_17200 [Leptospira johnsonii]